jgi:hypothetical protein
MADGELGESGEDAGEESADEKGGSEYSDAVGDEMDG